MVRQPQPQMRPTLRLLPVIGPWNFPMARLFSLHQYRWAVCALVAAGLAGCASPRNDSGWMGTTLESLGITKPVSPRMDGELAARVPTSRRVRLRLHAAPLV